MSLDRGLPLFDRGYTVICFTFAAHLGGFFSPCSRRFKSVQTKFFLKSTLNKKLNKIFKQSVA
uniref:Uncharacterized protein n=1 Tax=Siphoviridae sp. ctD3x5 TaxID=2825384 RepID=A0A8S5PXU0_9CAUD|nr:MAG TPA: hypothetical protein [Siphoviridae sp. ctD3x5]